MRFGISISHEYPAGVSIAAGLDESLEQVRCARNAGFDAVYVGQHYLSYPTRMIQTIPLLARVAAESGEMNVGTLVMLLPLHNPVHVAETIASLDVITGGRFIFGVGLGYREEEFSAFGVKRSEATGRFIESLEIIRALWESPKVDFRGTYYNLRGARIGLRPVQKPYPPIWVGASGNGAVVRAAALGLPWVLTPNTTISALVGQWQLYRRASQEAGAWPPVAIPIRRDMIIGRDRRKAVDVARPHVESKMRELVKWGFDRGFRGSDRLDVPFDKLIEGRFIVGTPEECIEGLRRYEQLFGVTEVILRLRWPGMPIEMVRQSIRLVGEEVIPALQKSSGTKEGLEDG